MSQIKAKYIKFSTSAGDVNASVLPANRTASNYTPSDTSTKGHLDGIDTALGGIGGTPGDIGLTSFSAANNQSSPANVTGLAFANASIRSFRALVSVAITATSNLYEQFQLDGIQKDSSWDLSVESMGDSSGVIFSITSLGQVQYVSGNISGFVSDTIKFRAQTLSI